MQSYYEALPIYKAAMEVAVRVDTVVQRLAKEHKYPLGGRLRETVFDVVVHVVRCNRPAYLFERPVFHAPAQEKNK